MSLYRDYVMLKCQAWMFHFISWNLRITDACKPIARNHWHYQRHYRWHARSARLFWAIYTPWSDGQRVKRKSKCKSFVCSIQAHKVRLCLIETSKHRWKMMPECFQMTTQYASLFLCQNIPKFSIPSNQPFLAEFTVL